MARTHGHPIPDVITDHDRGWLLELLHSCDECGHPTKRGHCASCDKTVPVDVAEYE